MSLAALVFDVDGTLAETEELHRQSFNEAFAAAGLPWHWDKDLYARLLEVTGGKERIAHWIEGHHARPALDKAAIAQLHADKTARYTGLMAGGTLPLRPGVLRLLDEARAAGLPLAIATTTSMPNVVALLCASLGPSALSRFAVIAAGDVVPAKKPAPDVYQLVLDRLRLPPERCVAVEDTVNGLRSAMGAGIPTLITCSLYGGTRGFDGALAVVNHLGDTDQPCRVLHGPALPRPVVSLDGIKGWLASYHGEKLRGGA